MSHGHKDACRGERNTAHHFIFIIITMAQKNFAPFRQQRKMTNRRGKTGPSLIAQDNFLSKLVTGPNDPPRVMRNLQTTVRFAYKPTTGATAYTPYDLLIQVPGNKPAVTNQPPPYWSMLRLVKVSVWNTGDEATVGSNNVQLSFLNDPRTFQDTGIRGATSAALHGRPPLQTLQTWFGASDNSTQLFGIFTPPLNGDITVHVTCELMSPL